MEEKLKAMIGDKIAFWCVRYTYRGVIAEVTDETVTLKNAYMIEVSGSAESPKPEREDKLTRPITIPFQAIENMMQPEWCFAD